MGLNLKPKLYTEKSNEPSTAVNHLLMFDDDPVAMKFVDAFKAYNSAAKTHSSFVVGFLKHLRSDGLFHPTYMLAHADREGEGEEESGTVTGRTSLKDPAAQTIPKRTKWTKKLRRAFIAPPGYVILQLDFSQGELRICAVVAEEPVMIQAYASGQDLHAITAAKLMGYKLEDFMLLPVEERDLYRGRGKAGNFGLIYGMQAPGFQTYAFNSYGVKLTAQEAFDSREGFFDLYSRLPKWHEESILTAHRDMQIWSPLGRVRHLPLINSKDFKVRSLAERQAINSPIQSCLSDMMQLGMIEIDRQYGHEDIHMFLMTHDSIALYVPEQDARLWGKRCKDVLENLPLAQFGWEPSLMFPADAEAGANLAELQKLKNL
jgi:DNA polymerase I-like protein with 3'-5' exonuclease and polymerase domains